MKTTYMVGIAVAVFLVVAVVASAGVLLQSTNSGLGSNSLSSSSSSSSQGGGGQFAVLASDPPITAAGVSAAAVNYDSVYLHNAGESNSSGWVKVEGSGSFSLTGSAGTAQTIAKSNVQTGTYDMLRLHISSASVTYNGKTYSAAVASSNITARTQSGFRVNSTQNGAADLDLRTFIMNTGTVSSPQLVFAATAKATAVASTDISSATMVVGDHASFQGHAWWTAFEDQTAASLTISSATISSNSLNLHCRNTGNESATIQTVIVTPVRANASVQASSQFPASLNGSALFTVGSDGSLQATNSLQGAVLLGGYSTSVGAQSSTSIGFSGNISLDFGILSLQLTSGVTSGQNYIITVVGANTFASAVVTAQ